MKKLILFLLLLFSLNIYAEEKQTMIASHPVIYARIKVKMNNDRICFLRYDKINNIYYTINNGIHKISILYEDSIGPIEIEGKEFCEEFINELEDFNRYLKTPRTGMVL